ADIVFVPCCARKHERINDDIFRRNPVLRREKLNRSLRNSKLPLTRERLGLDLVLINAPDHKRRAEFSRHWADALELLLSILQVDGIDNALALAIGERELDRSGIGGVDHHWRFDLANQLLVEERYVSGLIAIARLEANIDDMRAIADLPARDLGRLFPLLFADHLLEEP